MGFTSLCFKDIQRYTLYNVYLFFAIRVRYYLQNVINLRSRHILRVL